MNNTTEEILGKIHLAVRTEFFTKYEKNMQFLADDILEIIKQEKSAITQAMLDALPEKKNTDWSEQPEGLNRGKDYALSQASGWNNCIDQMETAIKKMGDEL